MSTAPGGPARWWGGLGRGQRVVAAVVAVVVGVNVVLSAAGSLFGGDPGGPVSSSFSTGTDGLEAYADLLAASDRPVDRLRDRVSSADLDGVDVVVLADPEDLTTPEAEAIAAHVASGGRLVLAGADAADLLGPLTGAPVRWVLRGEQDLTTWVPAEELGTARTLAGDAGGRWVDVGGLLPVAGADGEAAIVTGAVGEGRVVALADADLLHNRNLARSDNAALGLALAGPEGSRVAFVESVHGFSSTGWAAVPPSWRWAAAGLVLTLLLGLWAAGTRFGPPEAATRSLRPARREHVEALAADLQQVSPRPADLQAELRQGALAAAQERRRRGIEAPATVPADPHRGGTRP